MALKVPFGLRNGIVVEISRVERGLKCNCVCINCNQSLIARKGDKRVDHFAHHHAPECNAAYETAIHKAAKQILETELNFVVPAYRDKVEDFGIETLIDEEYFDIDKVELEKTFGDFRADAVLYVRGRPIIIEIAVTHRVDTEKRKKIEKVGISAIEIDLTVMRNEQITLDQLRDIVIYDTEWKRWIHNEKADEKYQRRKADLSKEQAERDEIERIKKVERDQFLDNYKKPITIRKSKKRKAYKGEVWHVDNCLEKKRIYHQFDGAPIYYANVNVDCKNCKKNFRGFRDNKSEIVCLAPYWASKR